MPHNQLVIIAESLVDLQPAQEIPSSLSPDAWDELDALVGAEDCWEMLLPSEFAKPTPCLEELKNKFAVHRRDDPLSLLRELNAALY